jgi:hypothetical protein
MNINMSKEKIDKYTIIRDTQEKKNFWEFAPSKLCAGTIDQHLVTGDYTIQGLEQYLCIERKGRVAEWAQNIIEKRFVNELERMRIFPFAFVILEFELKDIMNYPYSSDIPPKLWPRIKITPHLLLKKTIEFQCEYPQISFIFAGEHGKTVAGSIFKRVIEKHEASK